jgi:hypothetical protein
MTASKLAFITSFLLSSPLTNALPYGSNPSNAVSAVRRGILDVQFPNNRHVIEQDDDGFFDPWDFSNIKSFAALGDSFAAGIGVGEVTPQDDAPNCSRYTGGYPLKMQKVINAQNFQYVACSGDVSKDVREIQLPKLKPPNKEKPEDKTFDLITMSAGGNDVGFADVLKACLLLPSKVWGMPL